ncbi:MAG: LptF/LptG family permease [Gemmatimonadetes bacterium]|nr:LptF/LptG family permease [Gemmatimonadota bacterium]
MIAELDAITEPAEQTRFALGALTAIGRLAVSGYTQSSIESLRLVLVAPLRERDARLGGLAMSEIMTRQLLHRHARPFALTLATLTLLLVANQALQWVPQLGERGASAATVAEVLLLSVPFTLALTVPMAVFLSVCWVFTRLGREGALGSTRGDFRRLVMPVVGAAAVVATLTLVLNTEVLPRTNTRLAAVLSGSESRPTDRTMTIGELRDAAQSARSAPGEEAVARAAAFEVEIQKRFALAAACMVLALAGASIVTRFPRGGMGLLIGGGTLVFAGYYAALVAGESLADQQLVAPGVAMWLANALLLAVALLLAWRPSRLQSDSGSDALTIEDPEAA